MTSSSSSFAVMSWKVKMTLFSSSYQHGKLLALFWSDDRWLTRAHKFIIVMTHFDSPHESRRMGEISQIAHDLSTMALESAIENEQQPLISHSRAADEFSWTFSTFLILLIHFHVVCCHHWELHQTLSIFHFLDLILHSSISNTFAVEVFCGRDEFR